MKSIIRTGYGPPERLRFDDEEVPVPAEGRVVVKVHASSVNPYDWHQVTGEPYLVRIGTGLLRPKDTDVGLDLAGTVTAVGEGVTTLKVGDEVFGNGVGAFAEYGTARADRLARKPSSMSFDVAAALPCAGVTAWQAIHRDGSLQPGQSILINGASGGVGTFAVQIAKAAGATVTAVCSTRNLELVRSIGADDVVDYTKDDFARGDRRYDVVLDAAGNRTLGALRRAMAPGGTLLLVTGKKGKWLGPVAMMARALVLKRIARRNFHVVMASVTTAELDALAALHDSGKLHAVIDRTYPLSDCIAAIRYVGTGHARGKVLVTP
jgi:NADPH:quinone reductase-like Zn-dependent oxidoreductase